MKKQTDRCGSCGDYRSDHNGQSVGGGIGLCTADTSDPDRTCMGPTSICGCAGFKDTEANLSADRVKETQRALISARETVKRTNQDLDKAEKAFQAAVKAQREMKLEKR